MRARTLLVLTFGGALAVSATLIWLAIEGGPIAFGQHSDAEAAQRNLQIYQAVYAHFFHDGAGSPWAPLRLFVRFCNVLDLYIVAPVTLIATAGLLGRRVRWPVGWLAMGLSIVVAALLLWKLPELRRLAIILD